MQMTSYCETVYIQAGPRDGEVISVEKGLDCIKFMDTTSISEARLSPTEEVGCYTVEGVKDHVYRRAGELFLGMPIFIFVE